MTIKLNETGLTAVVVPGDAEYKISGTNHFCIKDKLGWDVLTKLEGNIEILGEVTADEISKELDDFLKYNWNWTEHELRDLLKSKEIYYFNPMRKPELPMQDIVMYRGIESYEEKFKEWQSYESKIVKKVVIINKL